MDNSSHAGCYRKPYMVLSHLPILTHTIVTPPCGVDCVILLVWQMKKLGHGAINCSKSRCRISGGANFQRLVPLSSTK